MTRCYMKSLRHYALGETCPLSPHAVVSSLPTMADVRGYEEGEPRVLEALKSGYPRFVVHAYIKELIDFYLARAGLSDHVGVLIAGGRATRDLVSYVRGGVVSVEVDASVFLVYYNANDPELHKQVRKFVQHTGISISSRYAEDLLFAHGLRDHIVQEPSFGPRALDFVEGSFAELVGCSSKDVLVCSSGMNAFYAGFRAVQEAQSSKGRGKWLQLGWLYLDSGCVLKEFLGDDSSLDFCYDATNTEAIVSKIESMGESLSCVVVECPTNPLVQVADLARIAAAVRAVGGCLLVDPTIASVYNVDVLRYSDLLVTSLTKYASFEGDVMIGVLAVNPDSPFYGDLILRVSSFYLPPYSRDLERLAHQMERAPEVVKCVDRNARELTNYLREHSSVAAVHYAGYSAHFDEVARKEESGGAMITVELAIPLEEFYDRLAVMKGPSFGTVFTLVCPFMYLAHYDLVNTEEGRAFLRRIGIAPDLVRISVGAEPIEEIISAFEVALEVYD